MSLRFARAARSSTARRSTLGRRVGGGSDQALAEAGAATEVLLTILRAELNGLEAGRHEAEAREAAWAQEQHKQNTIVQTLQANVWKATRARVPASMEEAIEAALSVAKAEWEATRAKERRSHEEQMAAAVTAARVEAAEQANRDISAAAIGGGQGATQPPPPSNSKANGGALDEKSLREQLDRLHQLHLEQSKACLLYTSPSPRDRQKSRMPSSA